MDSEKGRTAYIGLGSNLASPAGSPGQTIFAALQALQRIGGSIRHSSLYETSPVGVVSQPRFINAAAALQTNDEPEEILRKLLLIEREFGRDRDAGLPKGPRTLDLDLLLLDDRLVSTPELSLPHPALAERRFVLAPLAEIAPDLRHPLLGQTMRELLMNLPDDGSNRIADVRRLPPNR